jgi:hypothetical protein
MSWMVVLLGRDINSQLKRVPSQIRGELCIRCILIDYSTRGGFVLMGALQEEFFVINKSADFRLELVQRIHVSALFRGSTRLRDFLSYIVNCAIRNAPQAVTEQQIGIHVFGRRVGYNTNDDNIVRSQARLLRLKLASYFAEEGRSEKVILIIPRGQYLPYFQPSPTTNLSQEMTRKAAAFEAGDVSYENCLDPAETRDAQRVRFLEDENWRLKQLVADLSLDREAMKAILIDLKTLQSSALRSARF